MAAMARIMDQDVTQGIGFERSGVSLQEIISGRQATILFAVSLLAVFWPVALCASGSVPVAVMLVVPLGVLGGMVGASLLGVLFLPVFFLVVRRLLGDRTDGTDPGGSSSVPAAGSEGPPT